VITKDRLQDILNTMPEKVEVEEIFDKILLSAKIEQGLADLERGESQDWEKFKAEWRREDEE